MNPSEITSILARLGARPSKSKGQNFLVDGQVADRHVEYAEVSCNDTILEVGPGLGILTTRLAEQAKKVIAIEADAKLAAYLRDVLPDNVELIEGDALKVPFPPFDKFVSNIPYSISSPLIFKLLEHDFQRAAVMLQKEFADRMVARPNTDDYSRLTVSVSYRAECRILEKVSRSKFWPSPKVDSAIVELIPHSPPFTLVDEDFFFHLTTMLFQNRRKKIGTILKMRGLVQGDDRSRLPYMDLRAEALAPEQIGELANRICELNLHKK